MTLRKLILTACAVSACGPGEGLVHATWSGTLYGEPSTADLTMKLTESRRYFIEAEERKDARLGSHRLFQQKALVLKGPGNAWPSISLIDLWTVPLVGKGAALMDFDLSFPDGSAKDVAQLPVDVTSVRYTGNPVDPIEVNVAFDTRFFLPGSKETDAKLNGELTMLLSCDPGAPQHVQFFCGASGLLGASRNFLMGESTIVTPKPDGRLPAQTSCPAEIGAPWGIKDGAIGLFKDGSFTVGSNPSIPCDSMHCHAEKKGVVADGCSWSVTAIVQPGLINSMAGANQPTGLQLATQAWVSAVAESGCQREQKFCQLY